MSAPMKTDYYMDLVTRHGARLVIAFLLSVIEQLRRDRVQREREVAA
jgi:hypothetical protein